MSTWAINYYASNSTITSEEVVPTLWDSIFSILGSVKWIVEFNLTDNDCMILNNGYVKLSK